MSAMRLLRNGSWVTLSAVLGRGATFLSSILVARLLGSVEFGAYTMVWATVAAGAVFGGFALNTTACKFLTQFKETDPERAGRITAAVLLLLAGSSAVAASVYPLLAGPLAQLLFSRPELSALLVVSTVALVAMSVETVFGAVLVGLGALRILALVQALRCAVLLGSTYALTARAGLSGAIWALNLGLLAGALLTAAATIHGLWREGIAIRIRGARSELSSLLRFSTPMYLVNIVSFPLLWIGLAVLARQPEGLVQVAHFGIANRLRDIALFVPGNLAVVALALLPASFESGGISELGRNAARHLRLTAGISLVAVVGLTATAGLAIRALYGPVYATPAVVTATVILLFSCFASAITALLAQVFRSADHVWTVLGVVGAGAAVFLLGLAGLAPGRGAVTLATLWLAAQAVSLAVSLLAVCRAFGVRIYRPGAWAAVSFLFFIASASVAYLQSAWAAVHGTALLAALAILTYTLLLAPREREEILARLRGRSAAAAPSAGR